MKNHKKYEYNTFPELNQFMINTTSFFFLRNSITLHTIYIFKKENILFKCQKWILNAIVN